MKTEDIKRMAQAWKEVQEAAKKKLDPVGKADADIDNDGDVDKSDEYLHNRRKAVSKAMKGKQIETEVQEAGGYSSESVDFDEGSIKGSGTDRKAQLKKAYRDGEQKTRDFYKNKLTKDPRTSDKGIKKAFQKGAIAGDGSPTAKGGARSKPQDGLRGTEHDQSNVSPTSKSFRSTHSRKMYNIGKPKLPESFDLSEFTQEEIIDFMMTEDFAQLDELSKKTLGSYVKKASGNMAGNAAVAAAQASSSMKKSSPEVKRNMVNRMKGITRATDRLTKEEAEIEEKKLTPKEIKAALGAAKAKPKDKVSLAKAPWDMKKESVQTEAATHTPGVASPAGEGLSPNAKKELARKTPAPSDAFDASEVNKKTFDAIRASSKKAPMRSGDKAQGDKSPVK